MLRVSDVLSKHSRSAVYVRVCETYRIAVPWRSSSTVFLHAILLRATGVCEINTLFMFSVYRPPPVPLISMFTGMRNVSAIGLRNKRTFFVSFSWAYFRQR